VPFCCNRLYFILGLSFFSVYVPVSTTPCMACQKTHWILQEPLCCRHGDQEVYSQKTFSDFRSVTFQP
jgi:hypothetical protein